MKQVIIKLGSSLSFPINNMIVKKIEQETKNYYIIDGLKYRKRKRVINGVIAFKRNESRYFSDHLVLDSENPEVIEIHKNACFDYFYNFMMKEVRNMNNPTFTELYNIWRKLRKWLKRMMK